MNFSVFRRFALYLAALAICFFLADRGAGLLLDQVIRQSEARFSRLYRGGLAEEILILGNSRAVNAFYAPEIEKRSGRSVINLAYNGMSMEVAEAVLLDYLEHNLAPQLLLLEVTNLNVPSELLKDLRIYSGLSERISKLLQTNYPDLALKGRLFHSYRFNSEMFLRALFYMGRDDQDWINSGTLSDDFVFQPEAEAINLPLKAEGAGWEALTRIVDLCQKRKIELKLMASPYLPAYYQAMPNKTEQMQAFRAALPDAIPFYDYMNSVPQNNSFADVLHLNIAGSLELLELMIGDGVFEIN